MDKKTLKAMNNFALALEELVETFESKAKAEEDFGGLGGVFSKQQDMNNTILRIEQGIDNIKESNQKMLSNQEKILGMSKDIKSSQDTNGIFSFGKGKKNKKSIKEGVGTIILIAAGVLAIGMAFKLIGSVDFMSVIALSVALPLIAIAFTNIATVMKDESIGMGDILMTSISLVAISLALVLSSYILYNIKPIDGTTFISAIAVGAIFVVLSYAIAQSTKSLSNVSAKDVIILPLFFVTMSLAIVASSYILTYVVPISPNMLINIVLQAIALTILGTILAIPMKMFSALGLKIKDVFSGGIMLTIVAASMMASSWLINLGTYENYPSLMWAIGVGAALTVLSIPIIAMGIISMSGVGLGAIALGGIATLMVAGTIMLTSYILNEGTYDNYPGLPWILGVGASIVGFSGAMLILGFTMMTGIGALALLFGAGAISMISNSIVDVSKILSQGDFGNAGNLAKWAVGVTLLFITFVPIFLLLGAIAMAAEFASLLSFGTSPDPFEAGYKAIMMIGKTIRDVSFILGDGNYSGGPTPIWAFGVGMAISAFAPVFKTLSAMNIWSLFGGSKFTADDYAKTIVTISMAIIEAADVFRNAPTRWEGGPTKEWAEGVGLAIGAFAPIFKILMGQGIMDAIFGTTVTPEAMGDAIRMISTSIMDAADIFNRDSGSYNGGPTKKWAEGVGQSITSFAAIYEWVFDGINWTPEDIDQANGVIYKIARSILHMAKIFQGYEIVFDPKTGDFVEKKGERPRWGGFPTKKWSDGVTATIKGFFELYEWVFDGSDWSESDIIYANVVIYRIARSILKVAEIMEPLAEIKMPNPNTAGNLAKNLKSWKKIVQGADSLGSGNLFTTAFKIKLLADGVDSLAKALLSLGGALQSLQSNNLDALNNIAGTFISFSVIDEDNFASVMDIVNDNSDSLAELFGAAKENLDKSSSGSSWFDNYNPFSTKTPELNNTTQAEVDSDKKTLDDLYSMLEAMNINLSTISQNSSNLSNYVNELRANPEVIIK